MICKNCAAMPSLQKILLTLVLPFALLPAQAEKADRLKEIVIEADQRGSLDVIRRHYIVSGNVVMSQGTLLMRAHQAEVNETPEGYKRAVLTAAAGQKVSFRQKRDGVDEYLDGAAERIEYDSKLETVRFIGNAVVRRLRGSEVADEVTGALITYDNLAEVFSAAGSASPAASGSGSGRVKMILAPRNADAPASSAASAPAPAKPASGR
jgi:lipopolysaccharide export system protein LptA